MRPLRWLTANQITFVPSNLGRLLPALDVLHLDNNRIADLDAGVFMGLTRVRVIDLSLNILSQLPSTIFKSTSTLEKLLLNNNNLSMLQDGIFNSLSRLTEL